MLGSKQLSPGIEDFDVTAFIADQDDPLQCARRSGHAGALHLQPGKVQNAISIRNTVKDALKGKLASRQQRCSILISCTCHFTVTLFQTRTHFAGRQDSVFVSLSWINWRPRFRHGCQVICEKAPAANHAYLTTIDAFCEIPAFKFWRK